MMSLRVVEIPTTSAEEIRAMFRNDDHLPGMDAFDKMMGDPSIVPTELRVFDLVFPKAVSKGLSEGGSKVTDDSIGMLVWNGERWEPKWLLSGRDGWGCSGPDHCGPRARVVRYNT